MEVLNRIITAIGESYLTSKKIYDIIIAAKNGAIIVNRFPIHLPIPEKLSKNL